MQFLQVVSDVVVMTESLSLLIAQTCIICMQRLVQNYCSEELDEVKIVALATTFGFKSYSIQLMADPGLMKGFKYLSRFW